MSGRLQMSIIIAICIQALCALSSKVKVIRCKCRKCSKKKKLGQHRTNPTN